MNGWATRRPDGLLPWPESRNAARNARALRIAAHREQEDVAREAGLTASILCAYEKGYRRIPAERAEALARALGTTTEALTADGGVRA